MYPHHSEQLDEEYESDEDGEEIEDKKLIVIVTAAGAAVRLLLFEIRRGKRE